jgi:DNA adenine methylase
MGVVNVASVPQRSPFRYPGGKTWLVPRVRRWLLPPLRERLGLHPIRPAEFIEPFAGGGSIGLAVAAEGLAEHVTLVELDVDIAAVWQTLLDPAGNEWLAQRILTFDLTGENVAALLALPAEDSRERAFQTLVRNRVSHGGILAPGAGIIKHGENGKGLRSRWYPATLARRIRAIAAYQQRITFIHGDGCAVLAEQAHHTDAVFFIDPPYSVEGKGKRAGKRLYTHHQIDHTRLFTLAQRLSGDVLMTYDNATEVLALANHFNFASQAIAMQNTHHATLNELLIGRDLCWLHDDSG